MKLKKLILSVLGLFVLAAVSHAAGNPELPSYKPSLKNHPNGSVTWCGYSNSDPNKEYPSLLDPNSTFKIPAKYIKRIGIFELLEAAVTKNDKIAAELVVYCTRKTVALVSNLEGIELPIVIAFYESPNSVKIIRYLVENGAWRDASTTDLPFKGSTRTDITIASEYGHKEILKALLTPAPKNEKYNPNPYAKVKDYIYDPRGEWRDSFFFASENGHIKVLDILNKVPKTTALIEDAWRKSFNYAMTNEKWILKAMREIADNSIFRDGLRLFDINGYKTDITRI
jgi:hypothetical protein